MNIYEEITDKIIKSLENGIVPWKCPFKKCLLPTNYKTQKHYNGMNTIILWLENYINGYTSNYWLGFNQAKQLNGKIKKGEKATKIIACFEKRTEKEEKSDSENFAITHFFKAENVFNLDQIEGINFNNTNKEIVDIKKVDDLIKKTGACIKFQGESAFFDSKQDYINMPLKSKFNNTEGYYSTLLHELLHWTGHKDRLNRLMVKTIQDRAFEELVAEIGASFLCTEYGISSNITNASSYIASWLKALKNDKKYIYKAVKQTNEALIFLKNLK